jgi:hypothetical protein
VYPNEKPIFRNDSDKKLVPLPGEEIGKLIAQPIEGGVTKRRTWYEPSEQLPEQPIVSAPRRYNLILWSLTWLVRGQLTTI